MDPLEIDVQGTSSDSVTPQVITLNSLCFKISMKICPSVKRWTCNACTSMCTIMCAASDEEEK